MQKDNDFLMNNININENNRGSINKTNVVLMHSYLYNNENKKYIIDIIFFIAQRTFDNDLFQDSVFLMTNFSNNIKYSDNQTYVINNNDIIEVALALQLNKYFHFGLSSKDNLFYSEGVFYDNRFI